MRKIAITMFVCAFALLKAQAQEIVLKNGALVTSSMKKAPTSWTMPKDSQELKTITAGLPKGISSGVEIDITKELKWDGFFCQFINLPGKNLKIAYTGMAKSSVKGIAYLQIKLFKGKKTIKVVNSNRSALNWSKLQLNVSTQDADRMQVLCRFRQKKQNIGQKVWFADLKITEMAAKISLVGDSTVCDYPENKILRGWGQMLPVFFNDNVAISNDARGGRSTKTFIKEKRWARTLADEPDYIFVQFGHNDSHAKGKPESTDAETDYKEYLRQYADDGKRIGATVIFVTPMHRRLFYKGKLNQGLKPYAEAMKAVAKEKGVAVVDLYQLSGKVLTEKGEEGSLYLFRNKNDRTHFCEAGATLMAEMVVNELKKQNHPLGKHLK